MSLFSYSGVLLFVWSAFRSGSSICNYVLHEETGTAWSTGVCIPMGSSKVGQALGYMKFSCPEANDTNQMAAYAELYTDSCDAGHFVSRTAINATLAPYTFECDGVDGCYVSYIQDCEDPTKEQLVASPVDTCVVALDFSGNTDRVFSYMYTCDNSEMVYKSFNNDNCDDSEADTVLHVTSCTETVNLRSWQFVECHSGEANSTEISTSAANDGPSSEDIPFYNMSWSEIQQYANSESPGVAMTVFSSTFHYVFLLLFAMVAV